MKPIDHEQVTKLTAPVSSELGNREMLAEQVRDIARRYEVADLYAFGCRAAEIATRVQGEPFTATRTEADVDLGVLLSPGANLDARQRVCLTIELEDALAVTRVDLVLLNEAEPFLALEVVRGELIYTDDLDRQARYELFVLRRAADLAPFKRERMRMILEEGGR